MPTYEYRCPKGHEFELFQRMSDEPGADCPECGEPAERIVSGGAGFLFKGEGFYITDYRSEEYKKKASSESSEKTAASSTSDGTSGGASSKGKDGDGKKASPSSSSSSESSSSSDEA